MLQWPITSAWNLSGWYDSIVQKVHTKFITWHFTLFLSYLQWSFSKFLTCVGLHSTYSVAEVKESRSYRPKKTHRYWTMNLSQLCPHTSAHIWSEWGPRVKWKIDKQVMCHQTRKLPSTDTVLYHGHGCLIFFVFNNSACLCCCYQTWTAIKTSCQSFNPDEHMWAVRMHCDTLPALTNQNRRVWST